MQQKQIAYLGLASHGLCGRSSRSASSHEKSQHPAVCTRRVEGLQVGAPMPAGCFVHLDLDWTSLTRAQIKMMLDTSLSAARFRSLESQDSHREHAHTARHQLYFTLSRETTRRRRRRCASICPEHMDMSARQHGLRLISLLPIEKVLVATWEPGRSPADRAQEKGNKAVLLGHAYQGMAEARETESSAAISTCGRGRAKVENLTRRRSRSTVHE